MGDHTCSTFQTPESEPLARLLALTLLMAVVSSAACGAGNTLTPELTGLQQTVMAGSTSPLGETSGTAVSDISALVTLYEATGGPNWHRNDGWLSDTRQPGSWYGVTTDANGRVIELNLWANGLTGQLPTEIGQLHDLERLRLDENELTGDIPPTIGTLVSLRWLFLSSNQLSGPIPLELGNLTNLTDLYLDRNDFEGRIPEELGNLASLQFLNLLGNNLSGEIPKELGTLTELYELELGYKPAHRRNTNGTSRPRQFVQDIAAQESVKWQHPNGTRGLTEPTISSTIRQSSDRGNTRKFGKFASP